MVLEVVMAERSAFVVPLSLPPTRAQGEGERSGYARNVNIEEFYAADERRRASTEVEFGREWRDGANVRYELSWVQDTGELYLMREPIPSAYEDPLGDFDVDSANLEDLLVSVLGVESSHERLEEILVGWPEAMAAPQGVEWLAERLRSAGIVS